VKEKPNDIALFFMAFPSDPFRMGTKDVSIHFFIHSNKVCKLYQRTREIFGANTCLNTLSYSPHCMDVSGQYHTEVAYSRKEPRIH
jgi:hypothetical protein